MMAVAPSLLSATAQPKPSPAAPSPAVSSCCCDQSISDSV